MQTKHPVVFLCLFSLAGTVFAADGVWTNGGGGNWSDPGKWTNGVVAGGADSKAAVSVNIGVDTHVITLDVARAVGTLVFSDNSGQLNNWTLSDGGNSANILTMTNTTAAVPAIISSNRMTTLDVILAGSQGLLLESKNTLSSGAASYGINLRRTNSYTGATTLRRGELILATNAPAGAPGAFGNDTSAIQLGDGSTLPTDILGLRLWPYCTMERDIEVQNVGSNVTIGATADTSGYWRSFKGALKLNRSIDLSCGSNGKILMEGLISGSGGLTINTYSYSGSLVEFYATNTYSGPTVISRGNINVMTNAPNGDSGAFGNATSDVILGDANTPGYTITFSIKPGTTFGRKMWIKDVGSANAVYLCVTAVGAGFYAGDIRIDRRVSLHAGTTGYKPTFTGLITGTGSVEITGTGEVIFENTNTFTGDFYHSIGNGKVSIGRDVVSGQPGVLGNSTNPIYFAVPGANIHYLSMTNSMTFGRNIRVLEGVKTQIGMSAVVFPQVTGDIDYDGDLYLQANDTAELLISGRLLTRTNSLFLVAASSLGNLIRLTNPSNTLAGVISLSSARLHAETPGSIHGATQIVYAVASGLNPSAFYAGNGVIVTQSIVMPLSPYNAGATLVELGMRTNGEAIFTAPVTLNRTNTTQGFTFTAPANGLARFTNTVSGAFRPRKAGAGTVSFEAANSWTGDTEIAAGTLRAQDGIGLPAGSRLLFTGGVLEATGTFSRVLGSAPGQVGWAPASAGGFSAKGGKLTVDLNNDGPTALAFYNNSGFVSNAQFRFGSPLADNIVDFIDPILLNNGATFYVLDNPATRADKTVLSGALSGAGGLTKSGTGTLVLAATNTLGGNNVVSADGGTLLVNGELPSNASSLTVNSNGWLGGKGTIRSKTVIMQPGSGFDWADDPGTLTITNSFTFPTNGVFRFVVGSSGSSKVVSGNKLTLPANATVEIVPLDAYPPASAVILSSTNTVGSPAAWTIPSNTYSYVVVKSGNDIILKRVPKGTLMMVN